MTKSKRGKIVKPYLRIVYQTLGLLSVALGIIGIILPILPTTPFFILAAYFFVRSSQSLYRRLLTHRLFGNYIKNYIQYKAISLWVKVFTLFILWATIITSIYTLRGLDWLQLLLFLVAVGVSFHVLRLRTMRKELLNEDENFNPTHMKLECGAKDKLKHRIH